MRCRMRGSATRPHLVNGEYRAWARSDLTHRCMQSVLYRVRGPQKDQIVFLIHKLRCGRFHPETGRVVELSSALKLRTVVSLRLADI